MIPGSRMGQACIFLNGPVTCQELVCFSCAIPDEHAKLEGPLKPEGLESGRSPQPRASPGRQGPGRCPRGPGPVAALRYIDRGCPADHTCRLRVGPPGRSAVSGPKKDVNPGTQQPLYTRSETIILQMAIFSVQ